MSKKEYLEYKKSYMLVPLSISFLLIIGVIVSLVQVKQQQTAQSRASQTSVTSVDCTILSEDQPISTEEQAVFDQINDYRKQHGRQPLIWSTTLKQSAIWMSKDMLNYNYLSHTDSRGRDLATRLTQCNFPFPATVDENIDSGTSDPAALMTAWEHAKKQNSLILNPLFNQVGIGFAKRADGKFYWTADFAGPAPTAIPTKIQTPTSQVIAPTTPNTKPNPTKSVTVTGEPTSPPLPSQINIPTKVIQPTITVIPTIDPKFVQNPLDTQIFVDVKYMGIGKGGNTNPKVQARKIQTEVYDLDNKLTKTGAGYIQYDHDDFRGIVHLGKIPNGKYYVKILSDFNLTAIVLPQFQELSNQRLNILPEVVLVQGDMDADNAMTVADYNIALKCFQDTACPDVNIIDFNDDGIANATDYNILLEGFLRNPGD